MALRLEPGFVDQNPRIRGQPSERDADVIVDHLDLPHRARILKLRDGFLLHPEHHAIGTPHANRKRALAHGFHGVLHLFGLIFEEMELESVV